MILSASIFLFSLRFFRLSRHTSSLFWLPKGCHPSPPNLSAHTKRSRRSGSLHLTHDHPCPCPAWPSCMRGRMLSLPLSCTPGSSILPRPAAQTLCRTARTHAAWVCFCARRFSPRAAADRCMSPGSTRGSLRCCSCASAPARSPCTTSAARSPRCTACRRPRTDLCCRLPGRVRRACAVCTPRRAACWRPAGTPGSACS